MKVRVLRSGGIAGIKRSHEIDTSNLVESQAQAVQDLVNRIDYGGPDRFQYSITIVMDDGKQIDLAQIPSHLIEREGPLDQLINAVLYGQFPTSGTPRLVAKEIAPEVDNPFCKNCGHITVRHNTYFKCLNCDIIITVN